MAFENPDEQRRFQAEKYLTLCSQQLVPNQGLTFLIGSPQRAPVSNFSLPAERRFLQDSLGKNCILALIIPLSDIGNKLQGQPDAANRKN